MEYVNTSATAKHGDASSTILARSIRLNDDHDGGDDDSGDDGQIDRRMDARTHGHTWTHVDAQTHVDARRHGRTDRRKHGLTDARTDTRTDRWMTIVSRGNRTFKVWVRR